MDFRPNNSPFLRFVALLLSVPGVPPTFFFEDAGALYPFARQRIPEHGRNFYSGLTLTW